MTTVTMTKKKSWLFLMSCKNKTHLCKYRSRSREDDFFSGLRYMWRTTKHEDNDQTNKLVLVFALVLVSNMLSDSTDF